MASYFGLPYKLYQCIPVNHCPWIHFVDIIVDKMQYWNFQAKKCLFNDKDIHYEQDIVSFPNNNQQNKLLFVSPDIFLKQRKIFLVCVENLTDLIWSSKFLEYKQYFRYRSVWNSLTHELRSPKKIKNPMFISGHVNANIINSFWSSNNCVSDQIWKIYFFTFQSQFF